MIILIIDDIPIDFKSLKDAQRYISERILQEDVLNELIEQGLKREIQK